MKAKFESTDPQEIRCLAKSQDMAVALWDIVYNLPSQIERTIEVRQDEGEELTGEGVFLFYRQAIRDELDRHNIIIEDLTE